VRIAVVTTSYPADEGDPSGHFVRAEVRLLARQHEVRLITPEPGGAFGWPGVASRIREQPLRAWSALHWVARARRALASDGPFDRIVAHWAVPSAWPIAVGAPGELEAVSHGADVRLLTALPAPARATLVRAIAGRASTWRFVSVSLRDELLDALRPREARLVARVARVQPCAIELPDVRAQARELRASVGSQPLCVVVARLVPSKRVDAAIRHAAALGPTTALVVVGDGPERERLQLLARDLGVRARFLGKLARPEALAWIAAADLVLHASAAEGESTVLREARALGVPVARA